MESQAIKELLLKAKRIAVVGASPNPNRPSNWISQYLMSRGYIVIPINPGHTELFGLKCYPDVESVEGVIDIVNIYRRSDQVLPIVTSALKKAPLQLIWMQDNVYNEEAAQLAESANIPVIMNDCIYRVHSRMIG